MLSAAILPADGLVEAAELLRAPQGDRWRLATTMPDGVAAALRPLGEPAHVAAVRAGGRVVAVGVRAVKAVRWRGEAARLGYLALLRRDPDLAPGLALPAMRGAFAALAATREVDELPFDLTAIGTSNRRAGRLLTAGLPGVPAYLPRAEFRVRVWRRSALAARAGGLRVRPVEASAAGALAAGGATALAPAMPRLPLLAAEADGILLACGRLDDQRAARGLVLGLPPGLGLLRPLANLARAARRLPAIPPPGEPISQAFIADWHWRPGRADAALAVAAELAAASGVDALCAGWCDDHPDAAALVRAFPPAEEVAVRWYAVGADPGPGTWHLDAGGL